MKEIFDSPMKKKSLKNVDNYHEWRRINVSEAKPNLSYCQSNIEMENEILGRLSRKI